MTWESIIHILKNGLKLFMRQAGCVSMTMLILKVSWYVLIRGNCGLMLVCLCFITRLEHLKEDLVKAYELMAVKRNLCNFYRNQSLLLIESVTAWMRRFLTVLGKYVSLREVYTFL